MGFLGGFIGGATNVAQDHIKAQREKEQKQRDDQFQVIQSGVQAQIAALDPNMTDEQRQQRLQEIMQSGQQQAEKIYSGKEHKGLIQRLYQVIGHAAQPKNSGVPPPPPGAMATPAGTPSQPQAAPVAQPTNPMALQPPPSAQTQAAPTAKQEINAADTVTQNTGMPAPPPSAQAPNADSNQQAQPTSNGVSQLAPPPSVSAPPFPANTVGGRAANMRDKEAGLEHGRKMEEIKATVEARGDSVMRSWVGDDGKEHILVKKPNGSEVEEIHGGVRPTGTSPVGEETIKKLAEAWAGGVPPTAKNRDTVTAYMQDHGMKPTRELATPAIMREYEYSQKQGFQGTFLSWLKSRSEQSDVSLSADAKALAAHQYLTTGVMPSVGLGAKLRAEIMNEAGRLAGDMDVASNQAAFAANKASLTNLQKNTDAIKTFEQTAQKNLDLFINTAKKVVDTGSPWVNTPLRLIDEKLLGDEDLAALRAARQVASNEIARVTTGNMSGTGIVTDRSRSEYDAALSGDATMAQIYATAGILRQDMANRIESNEDQTADVKKRLNLWSKPKNSGMPSPPPSATGGAAKGSSTLDKFLPKQQPAAR